MANSLSIQQSSKDYFIVSIIGVQNSGKSTLLNNLFGTGFKVLTTTSGTQTTKGIWIAKDSALPLLVLDVEGNDSMERASENDNVRDLLVRILRKQLQCMLWLCLIF